MDIRNIIRTVLGIYLLIPLTLDSVTLVYNMRIRRLFALNLIESGEQKMRWVASAVPVLYQRSRTIIDNRLGVDINLLEKRVAGGSLFNIRGIPSKNWWFELTTGLIKEHGTSQGTINFSASKTGFDDFVFAAGYNMFFENQSQFVLYGIAGIPTTRTITPLEAQDAFIGTRFFSAGVGSEFSYSFIGTLEQTLAGIFQNRFLHFFSRPWSPILPEGSKIQPGNATDLLFAMRYRKKRNMIEAGYNPTFFTNQAIILPTQKIKSESFIRQSVYGSYTRLFKELPVFAHPGLLGIGFNRSWTERFATSIYTFWCYISILF
jgi:hypothetical protein